MLWSSGAYPMKSDDSRYLHNLLNLIRVSLLIGAVGGGWVAGAATNAAVGYVGLILSILCAYVVHKLSGLVCSE